MGVGDEPLQEPPRDARTTIDPGAGPLVLWFDRHTRLVCLAASLSALVNLALCTVTSFIGGTGDDPMFDAMWDWDVLLACTAMQASNGAIAACLYFRRLLRHPQAKQRALALVGANTVLRVAVIGMLLEIVLSQPYSNDGECKRENLDGSCAEWWYIRTPAVQSYAGYSLVTMALDTVLTVGSTLNLRAILRLEQHADALMQVQTERSGVPLIHQGGAPQMAAAGAS